MHGDQARYLVDRYADMILRISYSYLKQTCDTEDICQTVFLKYLTANVRFASSEHEKAWIIRTTVNACKDHVKASFFRRTVPLEDASHLAAPQVPDSEILDALKTLPEKYRVPIYLYYYEDYTSREIGEILGKSESSISQCLSRGRKMLRRYLEQEGDGTYAS